jgi:hypothetical protein
MNTLCYDDDLKILRNHIKDESVDLVYLDPPFNSNRNYKVPFAITVSCLLILAWTAIGVSAQVELKYFNYKILGTIADESGRPAADINVCWYPAERPLSRIPCTVTDAKGHYALDIKDVPDKYVVSASSYQGLLVGGAGSPGKAFIEKDGKDKLKEIKEYRSASGELVLGALDESRTVDLQLTLYRWSDKAKSYLAMMHQPH